MFNKKAFCILVLLLLQVQNSYADKNLDDSLLAKFPSDSLFNHIDNNRDFTRTERHYWYGSDKDKNDNGLYVEWLKYTNGRKVEIGVYAQSKVALWWEKEKHCSEEKFFVCTKHYYTERRLEIIDDKTGKRYPLKDIPEADKTYTETYIDIFDNGKQKTRTAKYKGVRTTGRFTLVFSGVPYSTVQDFVLKGGDSDDYYEIRNLGGKKSKEENSHASEIIKTLSNDSKGFLSARFLTLASNKYRYTQYEDVQIALSKYLNHKLKEMNDIGTYSYVINTIHEDAPNIDNYANDFARLILNQIVIPANDIEGTSNFIDKFSYSSGDILSDAYNHLVKLETEKVIAEYDRMIDSGINEFDAKERLARKLYIEAIRAKDDEKVNIFASKYHIATRNELFNTTEASFNLHRDKEMRDFLKKKFDDLIKTNRKANYRLTENVKDIITAVNNVSAQVASQSEVLASQQYEESLSDEYARNQRFMFQQLTFDNSFRK